MFAKAIKRVSDFTRPIKTISRTYKSANVIPGAATLFFVNDEGWAVTCGHVAKLLIDSEQINAQYQLFRQKKEQAMLVKDHRSLVKRLEKEFNYRSNTTIQVKNNFLDCVTPIDSFNIIMHGEYDLAILHFSGFTEKHYQHHAVFARAGNIIAPGDFLCRLGFPFSEFSNYNFDFSNDDIVWTEEGNAITPRFPIEGMFTRHLLDRNGEIFGIELSTPGLLGQSGGPLFNADGIVFGMQSATRHFHLGFDMKDFNMPIAGRMEAINNQPFLHVGHCVHVDIIKRFLDENQVIYFVGGSNGNEEIVNG